MRCFSMRILMVCLALAGSIFMPISGYANDPDNVQSTQGTAHLEDDLQLWTPIVLQKHFSKRTYGTLTLQPRLSNNIRDITQLIGNATVGFQVHPRMAVEAGYEYNNRFQWNNPDQSGRHIWEHRAIQGVLLSKTIKKIEFTSRHRIEQRFIENAGGVSLRSRHLLGAKYKLGKHKKWYVLATNELLISLNDTLGPTVIEAGVNQNRTLLAVGRQLNEHITLEGGYLLQYINQNAPTNDNLNHVIQLKTLLQF